MISIKEIGKAEALRRLYNNSKPLGLGFLQATPEDMHLEEAIKLVNEGHLYFDYLKGRVMKVNLEKDEFNEALYDRDNGPGAALKAIKG